MRGEVTRTMRSYVCFVLGFLSLSLYTTTPCVHILSISSLWASLKSVSDFDAAFIFSFNLSASNRARCERRFSLSSSLFFSPSFVTKSSRKVRNCNARCASLCFSMTRWRVNVFSSSIRAKLIITDGLISS